MRIKILYPDKRFVSPETLLMWAHDALTNAGGVVGCYDSPEAIQTIEAACEVLCDTGVVNIAAPSEWDYS